MASISQLTIDFSPFAFHISPFALRNSQIIRAKFPLIQIAIHDKGFKELEDNLRNKSWSYGSYNNYEKKENQAHCPERK